MKGNASRNPSYHGSGVLHGSQVCRRQREHFLTPNRGKAELIGGGPRSAVFRSAQLRSEEHTSELQSRPHLVCRLLLEKNDSLQWTDLALSLRHLSSRVANAF